MGGGTACNRVRLPCARASTVCGAIGGARESGRMSKAKDVIGYAKDKKVSMVDLTFMDFLGLWQHFTIPLAELTEGVFDEGLGFDGSSIRGWMPIHASDMLVVPDAETAVLDPFMKDSTLSVLCNIVDPITKEPYSRDPRYIAQKAEKYLRSTGIGDAAYFGPEAEFYIRFDSLVKTADKLLWFKYIVKNVALRNGKTVTFMPKPLFGDNGSGMHTHQSVWKAGKPLFAGEGYAGMSKMALHYIGGVLKHARALAALCNPTTYSYKRLMPGFEAPVNLAYSSRNRSAAIRIPMYSPSPKAKRIEFRSPDPSCNPYLSFSAMLMAGLDGIENRIEPGEPLDKDIYGLSPEELRDVPKMPGSPEEALGELKRDHEFLLKGDVFTKDVIEAWIENKIERELNPVRLRPTPTEFALYFDI